VARFLALLVALLVAVVCLVVGASYASAGLAWVVAGFGVAFLGVVAFGDFR